MFCSTRFIRNTYGFEHQALNGVYLQFHVNEQKARYVETDIMESTIIYQKKLKRKTSESQKEEKIISPRWIKWNECGNIPVEYTSFCKNVYHLNCSLGFSPLIHTSWFLHPFRTVHSKTTWIVCFGWQNVCKKYFTTCSHFHSSSVDCLHSNPPKATDCR